MGKMLRAFLLFVILLENKLAWKEWGETTAFSKL